MGVGCTSVLWCFDAETFCLMLFSAQHGRRGSPTRNDVLYMFMAIILPYVGNKYGWQC